MPKTLIKSLNEEQKQILIFAFQHGSYKTDTVNANYDEVKELETLKLGYMVNTSGSCLTGVRTLKLTLKGGSVVNELIN